MKTAVCSMIALAVWTAFVAAGATPARAAVTHYHAFVQGHSDTLVQYDFDGASDAERREDKKGSNNLVAKTTPSYDLAGFDASSRAVAGGFFTTAALGFPKTNPTLTEVSFEAIVKPSATTSGRYLAGAYDGSGNNRSYFGVQDANGAGGYKLFAAAGTSYGNQALIESSYDVGDWYYFAVTMSYDSGAAQTTINTYVANLSDGETILTQTLTNAVKPGSFLTDLAHGIGVLNHNSTAESAFLGTIDEISFYRGLKDRAFFQANLDRIHYVPEPSSLVLLGLGLGGGGLAIGWCRRRRQPGNSPGNATES